MTVSGTGSEDTADLQLPPELVDPPAAYRAHGAHPPSPERDLLDAVGTWGPLATPAGVFELAPVVLGRDLSLLVGWMNDPVVHAYWQLAGDTERTAGHVRAQSAGDGRSIPCLGLLDGLPISYWEIYRADLDPLARHYPSRLHDTGVHLLIGSEEDRGRGLGRTLLRAVGTLVFRNRPRCARVVAEPDVRNTASAAAFAAAGFRRAGEIELPDKRAVLMILDR